MLAILEQYIWTVITFLSLCAGLRSHTIPVCMPGWFVLLLWLQNWVIDDADAVVANGGRLSQWLPPFFFTSSSYLTPALPVNTGV